MCNLPVPTATCSMCNVALLRPCGPFLLSILQPLSQNDASIPTAAEKSEGRKKLEQWLNKSMRIKMTDGRILEGNTHYFDDRLVSYI